ncbi:MAG: hypothetical protein KAS36_07020 [Anaerolineales bacterium]|nr:hypothetical protein [Anaerolineales bacterium]
MCCFFTALVFFGPRLGVLVWWIFQPVRFSATFSTFIWPLLGLIFAPWTLLFYIIIAPGGIVGFDWVWLGLGVLFDVMSYGGGGYSNKERLGY